VYRYNERRWIGCYWKFSDNFNADWAFPEKWDPAAFPDSWDVNSDFYQTAAASKTAAHLLRYQRMCENNPRILPYVSSYGAFLAGHLDPQGLIPSWFTVDLAPVRELRFNAEGGVHIWFLCELYKATGQNEYLKTAERMAAFLMREILPSQRWYDFETFYSCSKKPENFYDSRTGQWPQCSLSMIWAIEGLAALFECTKNRSYLSAGEAVADYASFYQACWQPHFVTTAYAFGGYRSQNSDAEWLDMRHACAAEALLHLAALTHRQDLYERGAAAMRASFAIINHPRLIKNNIFCYPRYPLGIEPENIDHEGVPQDPLRSGFDWGEGGGLAAAAELLGTLGGAYIDLENNIAVGIDGVIVEHYQVRKNRIEVRLKNQLAALSFPYDASYEIDLTVAGLKAGQYQLVVDGGKPQIIKGPAPLRIPVRVLASSRTN
jgi:hypothetical protein